MCFSAPASFVASGALAVVGAAIVARMPSKRLLPVALIPWLFAIQQAAEGFVWLSLPDYSIAQAVFLFFAYSFWPIWIPFALWRAEKQDLRKQFLAFCGGIGTVIGLALIFMIPETTATSYQCSIHYAHKSGSAAIDWLGIIFYGVATLVPFFLSSIRRIWILGVIGAIVGILIFWIDQLLFVSMWCFFAALVSLSLLLILKKKNLSG